MIPSVHKRGRHIISSLDNMEKANLGPEDMIPFSQLNQDINDLYDELV